MSSSTFRIYINTCAATLQTTLEERSFLVAAAWAWNALPVSARTSSSHLVFLQALKMLLFKATYEDDRTWPHWHLLTCDITFLYSHKSQCPCSVLWQRHFNLCNDNNNSNNNNWCSPLKEQVTFPVTVSYIRLHILCKYTQSKISSINFL